MRIKKKTMILFVIVYTIVLSTYIATKKSPKVEINNIENLPETVPNTAYEEGYQKGYWAFLNQTGTYAPMAKPRARPVTAMYATHIPDAEVAEKEREQGYVDGYHKATESFHCPRRDGYECY